MVDTDPPHTNNTYLFRANSNFMEGGLYTNNFWSDLANLPKFDIRDHVEHFEIRQEISEW